MAEKNSKGLEKTLFAHALTAEIVQFLGFDALFLRDPWRPRQPITLYGYPTDSWTAC